VLAASFEERGRSDRDEDSSLRSENRDVEGRKEGDGDGTAEESDETARNEDGVLARELDREGDRSSSEERDGVEID
jgi:hypothetical protein